MSGIIDNRRALVTEGQVEALILERDDARTKLATLVAALGNDPPCGNCEIGHPLQDGVHIPTQRLGMIPPTPCLRAALRAARGEP